MGSPLIRRDTEEKTVLFFFFSSILEVEEDVEKELLHSESDWACMEDKKVQREGGKSRLQTAWRGTRLSLRNWLQTRLFCMR